MKTSEEMAFIKPWPPLFPMEYLQILEGFNLSAAQQKAIAVLKITYMKKLAALDIELYNKVIGVLENMESKV
ncbi:hypothetical protein EG827_02885 [bacterium]|jgi:hypothetical protein|nr:hypothetical protein [bacterium]